MKRIAIIPARGGSQRIPNKNIIDFMGKPLIAWSIEAASQSDLFDKIVVSTDSQEIADVSIEYGADVPFLRKQNSDNHTPVSMATHETLTNLISEGHNYDEVTQLMPVCPLRTKSEIKDQIVYFENSKTNFLISCYEMNWANPWWSFKLDGNVPEAVFPESLSKRSQDLEKLYAPTGAIWIANVDAFIKSSTFYGPNFQFFPIKWQTAVDIDTYEDLAFAKAIYTLRDNEKGFNSG